MKPPNTPLQQLQSWYESQCDGDWEHSYGIEIETLDNPGWWLSVDLVDTQWAELSQERIIVRRTDSDWVQTEITDGKFIGAGGPANLSELIELFFQIIQQNSTRD